MSRFSYHERDYVFGQQLLGLRTAIGMTQAGLAEYLGVSRQAVGDWEAGSSYPKAGHLKAFVSLAVERRAFHAGHEAAEIQGFWKAAHQKVLLDETWLAELLSREKPTGPGEEIPSTAQIDIQSQHGPRADWGDAPEVLNFYGRETELALLTDWLLARHCRVVSLLGMGGIGKTSLAAKLAQEVAPSFERVHWRSLRDALPTSEWLGSAIGFLSDQQVVPPSTDSERLTALLQLLRTRRCLLVMDNFETLFEPGQREGRYRVGVAGYSRLIQMIGETSHQSCLVLTSREAPAELAVLDGDLVRTFHLGGLGVDEARLVLAPKQLTGSSQHWAELTARFGGNALALKVVGERIRELFGGEISPFLEQSDRGSVIGSIRRLLAEQIERSTAAEQQVLRVLALARELVRPTEIATVLSTRIGHEAVLEAIEGLRRRSLVERTETNGATAFTLQSLVLEYVTDRLVEVVAEEIARSQPVLLIEQALIRAQAKDYVRYSQEQLVALSVLERLCAGSDNLTVEQQLMALLEGWRGQPWAVQGYGPGNVVNLLRLLRGDLRRVDLSSLYLRQVYLAEVDAQDSSLVNAHLAESVLAEGFHFPGSVALSEDGTLLVAGTSTGEVWLWRTADRVALWTVQGHARSVWGVALSADGHIVASGGADGMVRLWETSTGRQVATLEGHIGTVWSVALSGDRRLVASGGEDGTVRLWDAETGQLAAILQGHTSTVWSVALSADGRLAVSGSEDGTVRLWATETGHPLATMLGHVGAVYGVAVSGDGRLVVSGGADVTTRLWDSGTGQLVAILQGHTSTVWGVALSGNGHLVASGGADGTMRLWEANAGRLIATLQGHASTIRGLALSADGRLMVSGGMDGKVRLWEANAGRLIATLQGHTGAVWCVALSADGRLVASGRPDGTVRLWETSTGQQVVTLQGHSSAVWGVALSADGRLVASGSEDGTVRLWETSTGRPLATLGGRTGAVWGVALSADGRLVASGSEDGTVRLWETSTGQQVATLQGHMSTVRGVALSADGRLVASGGADGTMRLWETSTGQQVATLQGHTSTVWGVALSADGHLVASSSADGTVRLWETGTGQQVATLQGHTSAVRSVALSADGHLVASSSADGTVRLWEASTGQPLATLQGHSGAVWGVALSGDGHLVASGSVDGTVRLWEADSGDILHTLQTERRYERLDITGLKGITSAQRTALLALGAVDQQAEPVGSK